MRFYGLRNVLFAAPFFREQHDAALHGGCFQCTQPPSFEIDVGVVGYGFNRARKSIAASPAFCVVKSLFVVDIEFLRSTKRALNILSRFVWVTAGDELADVKIFDSLHILAAIFKVIGGHNGEGLIEEIIL